MEKREKTDRQTQRPYSGKRADHNLVRRRKIFLLHSVRFVDLISLLGSIFADSLLVVGLFLIHLFDFYLDQSCCNLLDASITSPISSTISTHVDTQLHMDNH